MLSVVLVVVGYWHCRAHAFSYDLNCKASLCEWRTTNSSIPIVSFPKADFIDAEVVRVDENGRFLDSDRLKDKKTSRSAGYSVRLKLRLPVEDGSKIKTEQYLMFAPYDLGRRVSKTAVSGIRSFLESEERDRYYYSRGRMITALGIICIFTGLVSLLLSCLFGQWMEVSPRRLKKSS